MAFKLVVPSELGVFDPDAVYLLKSIAQKNRTIKVYEFEPRGYNYIASNLRLDRYKRVAYLYNRGTR